MMQTLYSLGTRTLKEALYGKDKRLFLVVLGEAAVPDLSMRPHVSGVSLG